MMRMKDSDDYLTARAANPWTGVVSPSVGTPSPPPPAPCTPETAGEALETQRQNQSASPTPETKAARPSSSRANEGRKVSAGSLHKWRAEANGWVSETVLAAASPRETDASAGAALLVSRSLPRLREDGFVVHMPSAREPQPYEHPGRSVAEIEALERYKWETGRVSGEGYGDRSHLRGRRAISGGVQGVQKAASRNGQGRWPGHLQYEAQAGALPPREIRGMKRAGPRQDEVGVLVGTPTAPTFAPYSSPRTPAHRQPEDDEATVLKTVRVPGPYSDLTSPVSQGTPLLRRKAVGSASSSPLPGSRDQLGPDTPESAGEQHQLVDLSHLPRVRLVQPEFAGLPRAQARTLRQAAVASPRKCSLGCEKQNDTGDCLEQKQDQGQEPATGSGSHHRDRRPLFHDSGPHGSSCQRLTTEDLLAALINFLSHALDRCEDLRLPEPPVISTLRKQNATPEQKMQALSTLLSAAGQGLAVLMAVTVVWRLGAAVLYVVDVLLWPVVLPFRVLGWVVGLG